MRLCDLRQLIWHKTLNIFLLLSTTLAFSGAFAEESEVKDTLSIKKILLMPGKVTQSHAEFENQCEKCHIKFDKSNQNPLCLDCHDSIVTDFKNNTGYHGINKSIELQHCRDCHTDHKGREHNIIALDIDSFQHDMTNFDLLGKHNDVSCQQCHNDPKNYRVKSYECYDCHKEDDNHKGTLGKKCGNCHSPSGWKDSGFDHDKTGFPLRFNHTKVPCTNCHINNVFKNTPKQCISCHRKDDVHNGNFGSECKDCHSPRGWKKSSFDHARETGFPLRYRHKEISCESCHKSPVKTTKMQKDCYSCHKKDDVHAGRNGKECQNCHTERAWGKSKFNHNLDTNFKLLGAHEKLECEACHTTGDLSDNLGHDCYACHKNDDKHKGALGKRCDRCHNETAWNNDIIFTHEVTRFPLLGMHRQVSCGECHIDEQFDKTPMDCAACHQKDDVHEGTLGQDCGLCHNPNDWGLWLFDHDKQTSFPLLGSHKLRHCKLCHTKGLDDPTSPSQRCIACHEDDDVHNGEFGEECQECHNTNKFKDNRR